MIAVLGWIAAAVCWEVFGMILVARAFRNSEYPFEIDETVDVAFLAFLGLFWPIFAIAFLAVYVMRRIVRALPRKWFGQ